MKPLVQSGAAERGRARPALQAAQPTERPLFGRHAKSTGLAVSGLSPEGDGDACRFDRHAHAQAGRLGSGPALGPKTRSDGGLY